MLAGGGQGEGNPAEEAIEIIGNKIKNELQDTQASEWRKARDV